MKNPEPKPKSRVFLIPREETRPRTGMRLGLLSGDNEKNDPTMEDYKSAMDQFPQDPNADDDSGMDFFPEVLYNLDT